MKKMYPSQEELTAHKNEGVVEPTKLVKGTKLLVETTAKVFEFDMLGGGRAIVRSTGKVFKKDTPCQIVGSLAKDGTLFADMIVKEKHLIIALPRGRYVTGLIRGASLQGPGWSYEMWLEVRK
jgi:hypothetical protein